MITFENATSDRCIDIIANWYHEEWKIPIHETISSLKSQPNDHVYCQRMMLEDGVPIGSGGLYFQVGIQKKVEQYRNFRPWIGLMFTKVEKRGNGLGQMLLFDIEVTAKSAGFSKIFLFTHTAERLYSRNHWKTIDQIVNGEKTVFVMEKEL